MFFHSLLNSASARNIWPVSYAFCHSEGNIS